MRKKNIIIGGSSILLLLFIALIYFNGEMKNEKIHRGVKIDGVSVENLTKAEAIKKIEEAKEEDRQNLSLKFKSGEQTYSISYVDLGFTADVKSAVDEAYQIGRKDNPIVNFFNVISSGTLNKNIKVEESFNSQDVSDSINNLVTQAYIEPQNATMTYSKEHGFALSEEKQGQYVDSDKLRELVNANIRSEEEIELPIINSNPEVLASDFGGIDGLLVEFSTDYARSNKNRKENIALGASFFNNLLIKPSEEVSFNDTVGDISSESGFKEAGVIVNGEFDNGIGGGICQVSTTLYNALIKSDLEVTERYNHSRPISYVPLGTDAAVVHGYKDLKFINNTDHNLYIKAHADESELTFQIFGNKADRDYEVEIIPKLVSTAQPKVINQYSTELEEGESQVKKAGSKGYHYVTYKEIVKDGSVVKSEKISSSNYIAQDRVVLIGEGKPKSSESNNSNNSSNKNKDIT
ncbi:Vancomycin resistance protein YoaR, contains peptidoglycan-binding and VanW domains [Anaerosphaera aminiphila DSM 21120]|uniref:Vancomycin resistance protein YoaR, contains peptidoglycan-binding and VanW domains n=1 Tax=Anaerosphaera aminiphila DSM 21120 TaxID=1120995 RepID=A0A1M5PVN5_9FIRM|nr:VanW family protein [Anaerosphaera aminiphila]SHH05696.1 Vancomycin resistance protein YoaR, contains peptidoglycan-binding and VanW domains [Anaerosphaera aminiphila DSM 21120]